MGKGRRYDQEYKDMIVELFKSGMSLAELSSEYGIAKSTINGWIKDVKEIKVDENEVMTLKEVKALKKEMARIKGGLNAKKKHNRVLKLAKGYRGARSKQYRVAKQSVMRALTSSYAGRKERKRQFRQLWIARINAAARMNGLSYSKFMYGLKLAGVDMNRKMLADLAVNDAEGFKTLAELAKSKIA